MIRDKITLRPLYGLALLITLMSLVLPVHAEPPIEARLTEARFLHFFTLGVQALSVSDAHHKLAIAFKAGRPLKACLLELDQNGGFTTGTPLPLVLPEVADHKGMAGEAVAVQFHPQKPLLYLWRRQLADKQKVDTFDHLVVYDISDPQALGVVTTACSGVTYQADQLPAALALDTRARRLYLPTLQVLNAEDEKEYVNTLGYLMLDENGLPVIKPGGELAVTLASRSNYNRGPSGYGLEPIGDHILLTPCWRGVLYWDTNNRLAEMNRWILPRRLPDFGTDRTPIMIASNSRWIYFATHGRGGVASIRHINGYPTLLPRSHYIAHGNFHSTPVLMSGKAPALAIPSVNRLHVIGLRSDGDFSNDDQVFEIAWFPAGAPVAYSERADRLYIPVEGWP